jgi:hypothetical protein
MSQITLPGNCSWFYMLELSYNERKGFGITTNVDLRLRKGYCNPTASIQQFCKLYYGKSSQIQALERWFKNEYRSEFLILIDRKLEWIDPKSELDSIQKMVQIIEDRIISCGYDEIFRVKAEHLPFSPSPYFKEIKTGPDYFLEIV